MKLSFSFLLFFFVVSFQAQAQNDVPSTNIYLFDLEQETDTIFNFKNPKFLTDFNRDGYNNQPYFVRDNELLISSRVAGSNQNDIYLLDLEKGTKLQVTKTAESEYSPTLMADKFHFSAVRVELDDNGTQRLWRFPLSRQNNGKPVFEYLVDIGYHEWLDEQRVVLFIVSDPNYMVVADVRDGSTTQLSTNVGRAFKKLPNGNLAYVHKATESTWFIKELNKSDLRSEIIVQTPRGSEDFAVMRNGTFLAGRGTKLYKFDPKKDDDWIEIGDFRDYNITQISRLAVNSNGRLVLVGG
jgi:hypothetical protein